MEAGICPLQAENGGQKDFCALEPHRVLLGFTTSHVCVTRSVQSDSLQFHGL